MIRLLSRPRLVRPLCGLHRVLSRCGILRPVVVRSSLEDGQRVVHYPDRRGQGVLLVLLEGAETAVSDSQLLAFILQALVGLKWVLRQAHLLALHLQVLEPVDVASRGRGQRRRR